MPKHRRDTREEEEESREEEEEEPHFLRDEDKADLLKENELFIQLIHELQDHRRVEELIMYEDKLETNLLALLTG